MPQGHRPDRLGDQIRTEISQILAREVHDPGVGFVTITRVSLTADLQIARVYYTTMAAGPARKDTGRALQRIWLRATLLGIALQPMAASVVLPLQTSADMGMSESARSELRAGWAVLCPGRVPLMLFRLGYAAAPTMVASRKPTSKICPP